MLEQVYVYDLNDIKNKIAKTIERHKENIVSLEKQINQVEKAYNDFVEAYRKAIQELEENAGKETSLFYTVRDTVKTRYPYC